MNKSMKISIVLGLLMFSSAAVTKVVTPSVKMADGQAKFNLEKIIPKEFAGWTVDSGLAPLQVDPETQAKLDKIYNQTLTRTYINKDGQRVMLSMAYGGDQSDNMSVHKPEVCYTAQGFEVSRAANGALPTNYGDLPVKRLFAVSGGRNEPITYWITIGKKAMLPGFEQRMQQLRYGLMGSVPDGMLVRVSTIDTDVEGAYKVQEKFVNEMLEALDEVSRVRLIGTFGS